jgi:hypothetical protein
LFLYHLVQKEPEVASSHERNPENEAFHRYCKWHGLPVDDEGFLATKQQEILADLDQHAYSFEASPYVSLSVKALHQRFGAKFVFLIRRPDGVVTSFAHKGFYRNPYAVRNLELAAGYQDQSPERFFTYFARVSPRGEFLRDWNRMTQVGRVAWFWKAFNDRTLEALEELPGDAYRLVRIEDLDYPKYLELGKFLGFQPQVSERDFDALRMSRPHAFWRKRHVDEWAAQEVIEFESQVGHLAERFGYEYRVDRLIGEARAEKSESLRTGRIPKPRTPRFWRMRRTTAGWLRDMAKSIDV